MTMLFSMPAEWLCLILVCSFIAVVGLFLLAGNYSADREHVRQLERNRRIEDEALDERARKVGAV